MTIEIPPPPVLKGAKAVVIGVANQHSIAYGCANGRDELIIGEGSYAVLGSTAEVGFTVAEPWQGRGIASRLLQHLAGIARDQGIVAFEAAVLQGHAPMLAVFRHSGFPMTTRYAEGLVHVTLVLDSPSRGPRTG